MRTVRRFPHRVREIEHLEIPMPDGCRLAARAWIPRTAERRPVPAVLEVIPYRKRAGTRWRDEPMHRYFAGHGLACLRVDVRGTGESEGHLDDEYSAAELADGEALIAWVAAQPWCSGRVGLVGKSWGGIAALAVAARRPPALGAVVTVCSSDDRYAGDAHFMGGCLLVENLIWGSSLLTVAAMPPDPELVGPLWRERWRERLERLPLYPAEWMRHPRPGPFWERGSVAHRPGDVACPVLAVGGWADAYAGTVLRLLERLPGPTRGIVGPWAHLYPHEGTPGAPIGFLQECLAWWDRWLRPGAPERDSGPRLTVWIGEAAGGGRWVSEPCWPSPRVATEVLGVHRGELISGEGRAGRVLVASPASTGEAAGAWCAFGAADLPGDQGSDDERSWTAETRPLVAPLELLGTPRLRVTTDAPPGGAQLAVRLIDVDPVGRAERVSYGIVALPAGSRAVEVMLEACGHRFGAGHRLRLAVSTAYWPIAWPAATSRPVGLETGTIALELPVRRVVASEDPAPVLPPAEAAPEPAGREEPHEVPRREVRRPAPGLVEHVRLDGAGDDGSPVVWTLDDLGLALGHRVEQRFRIADEDPLTAEAEVTHLRFLRRPGWDVRVETRCRLTADAERFFLEAELSARDGEATVADRRWRETIPRR